MIITISGIIIFLILVLIAVKFGVAKQKIEDNIENQSVIHTSGIYSIVRKSPRENIENYKPSEKEIIQYLDNQTVDIQKNKLSESIKKNIISLWNINLEKSLIEIETGDKKGLEFYYYDFEGEDKICEKFIKKGDYITREEIYANPQLIPPFHLGCKCILKCQTEIERPGDTAKFGMRPLIRNNRQPSIPDWKDIVKI